MINNNLIKNYYAYEKKLIFCEIDRICAWKYYINNLDTKKVYKFNLKNINRIGLQEYLFLGNKEDLKATNHKIIDENEKIVFAKIYNDYK